MIRYLNGELIRIEPGREGSPVSHIVWDSYAGREVRIYPRLDDPQWPSAEYFAWRDREIEKARDEWEQR